MDNYLRKVRMQLLPLPAKKRNEILAEVRDDIYSRATDSGISEENAEEFVKNLEPPDKLAKKYLKIYGVSWVYLSVLCLFSVFFSIISVPVVPLPQGNFVFPESLAGLTVLILTLYVVWCFAKLSAKGWAVAITTLITRTAVYSFYYFGPGIEFDIFDTILFFITSLGILGVGYAALHLTEEVKNID
ncbi:MAG: HAAS signaling domain-containing protein [Thermoplasmata archaeon]